MRARLVSLATGALGAACLLGAAPALAQGEVSVQHFQPAIGPENFLSVDGARISDQTPFSLGVMVNYSSSPFRLPCEAPLCSDEERLDVVRHMFTTDILGAAALGSRLQLGLRIPFSHVRGDGLGDAIVAATFGDPSLELKWRALGAMDSPFVLGLAAHGSAPLGHAMQEGTYIGHSSFTGGVKAIADLRLGRWALAANVGALFRESMTVQGEEIGSALRYGGAIAYNISRRVRVLGETMVHTNLAESGGSVVEADAALQFRPSIQLVVFTLGGGAGFGDRFGTPVARAIVGVRFDTGSLEATARRSQPAESPIRTVSTRPASTQEREEPKAEQPQAPVEEVSRQAEEATAKAAEPPRPARREEPVRREETTVAKAEPTPPPPARPASTTITPQSSRGVPPEVVRRIAEARVYFEFNRWELRPEAYATLDELARLLVAHPELGTLEVAGHADNVGPREANEHVSRMRAQVVADYLVGKGVPRNRLVIRGYGSDHPEADNETSWGRARNRRIELKTLGR